MKRRENDEWEFSKTRQIFISSNVTTAGMKKAHLTALSLRWTSKKTPYTDGDLDA